jgi:hypothetical protein
MTGRPTSLDRRLLDAVRTPAALAVIPVLTGACGSGRTERLRRLQHDLGARACQYIDLERVSTTPERCLRAIIERSPFVLNDGTRAATTFWGARPAFDALLTFLMNATHADGSPAVFLLDEVLEVRTFESFPGLRSALAELARAIAHSRNRFIVSTRFASRARRWIDAAPDRFELVPLTPLAAIDVRDALSDASMTEADEFAPMLHALADGRPAYTKILLTTLASMSTSGGDPISALAAAMARGGELDSRCRFSYELRLHRARGYGALKAILDVLADEEPLTLTQIAQRLGRTPGSTKDYLSWLQDVDMLACTRKRYSYADPVLRLWVRIHAHPEPPQEDFVAREVQAYACERLQAGETASSAVTMPPPPASTAGQQAAPHAAQAAAPPSQHTQAAAAAPATTATQPAQPAAAPAPAAQPALAGAGALAAGAGAGSRLQPSGIIEID